MAATKKVKKSVKLPKGYHSVGRRKVHEQEAKRIFSQKASRMEG